MPANLLPEINVGPVENKHCYGTVCKRNHFICVTQFLKLFKTFLLGRRFNACSFLMQKWHSWMSILDLICDYLM
jgi:hypothetical protein